MVFKNDKQLKKFLLDKCAEAVDNTKKKIEEEFVGNLLQFYNEFKPEEYIRTGALLGALEVTSVRRASNQYMSSAKAEVFFNIPHYQHENIPLQSGGFGHSNKSDEEIFDIVMKSNKPHGGYAGGTPIWKESMTNLGWKKGIKNLLKQELIKQGL